MNQSKNGVLSNLLETLQQLVEDHLDTVLNGCDRKTLLTGIMPWMNHTNQIQQAVLSWDGLPAQEKKELSRRANLLGNLIIKTMGYLKGLTNLAELDEPEIITMRYQIIVSIREILDSLEDDTYSTYTPNEPLAYETPQSYPPLSYSPSQGYSNLQNTPPQDRSSPNPRTFEPRDRVLKADSKPTLGTSWVKNNDLNIRRASLDTSDENNGYSAHNMSPRSNELDMQRSPRGFHSDVTLGHQYKNEEPMEPERIERKNTTWGSTLPSPSIDTNGLSFCFIFLECFFF